MKNIIKNPILPGSYPDPSICRVGEDFYIANSSFSYFPGIPIFQSKDLVNWKQIGHALERPSQLAVDPYAITAGIYAPAIRYHDGLYYIVATNISQGGIWEKVPGMKEGHGGNFIVTAKKPEGPWSDPHWINGSFGTDPDLFWDDDGRAYFMATWVSEAGSGDDPGIWISEIDLDTYQLKGDKKKIWTGVFMRKDWPEAPHIYKKDGYYYILTAEGGTGCYHCSTVGRSKELFGPYEYGPANPILTMRHFGHNAPVKNAGHADMVELEDGSWYAVFLASRQCGDGHENMGRETFLAPVGWENGWPVISPGTGRVEAEYKGPDIPEYPVKKLPVRDDFDLPTLAYCWNILGTPSEDSYKLEDGCMKLKLNGNTMGKEMLWTGDLGHGNFRQPSCIGFMARRQQHMEYVAEAYTDFIPEDRQTAGISILQNGYQQLRIEIGRNEENEVVIRAVKTESGSDRQYRQELLKEIKWQEKAVVFSVNCNKEQKYRLAVKNHYNEEIVLAEEVDGGFLGAEKSGGFIGTYIGMFACGNGTVYEKYAAFDWFSYEGHSDVISY